MRPFWNKYFLKVRWVEKLWILTEKFCFKFIRTMAARNWIRNDLFRIRLRIRQKVSDPTVGSGSDSGSGSTTLVMRDMGPVQLSYRHVKVQVKVKCRCRCKCKCRCRCRCRCRSRSSPPCLGPGKSPVRSRGRRSSIGPVVQILKRL